MEFFIIYILFQKISLFLCFELSPIWVQLKMK